MNFVRFTRVFDYADPDTGRRTRYPAGWGGEIPAAVEKAASDAGALAIDPAKAATSAEAEDSDAPVDPGVTPAPNSGGAEDEDKPKPRSAKA